MTSLQGFAICILLALIAALLLLLAYALCRTSARAEDAHYAARRDPGMGDVGTVTETPGFAAAADEAMGVANSAEPIYAQLAAEALAGEIGTEAWWAWLEATS